MNSKEYISLMDALYVQGKKVEKLNIGLSDECEYGNLTFIDGSKMTVTEQDCVAYLFQLKRGLDNDGDYVFRYIKDLDKYFIDELFLVKDHNKKIQAVIKNANSNPFIFKYDVNRLQEEFLTSHKRNNKKFEHLKSDYYHIAAFRLHESAATVALHKKHQQSSEYNKCFMAITSILANAFRNDTNFIKNFAKKQKKANLSLLCAINKYLAAIESAQDINSLFVDGNGVNANVGVRLVLQTYSQKVEASIELLNFVRIAHELNSGVDNPELNITAQENKRLLLPALGPHLECLDVHIRNSEFHLNTRIDKISCKVYVSDRDGYTAEYSYRELVEMTNRLTHDLLPALLIGVVMESQLIMVILSNYSTEYITALLGINNS